MNKRIQLINRINALGRNEDGVSELVQTIMLIPLFMIVLSICISLMQLIGAGSVAMNAASSGCRQAIVEETKGAAQSRATTEAKMIVDASKNGISWSGDSLTVRNGGSWKRGNIALYTVTVRVHFYGPMAQTLSIFSRDHTVSKTCPMMIERNQ